LNSIRDVSPTINVKGSSHCGEYVRFLIVVLFDSSIFESTIISKYTSGALLKRPPPFKRADRT
jgi:hypothetical protein